MDLKKTIQLAQNQAMELIGYSVPFLKETSITSQNPAGAQAISGDFESMEVVDVREDGFDDDFIIEVSRTMEDGVTQEKQFIFSKLNPLGIFIVAEASKDGKVEPITIKGETLETKAESAIRKVTSFKLSKAGSTVILILAVIGVVASVRWIIKSLKTSI